MQEYSLKNHYCRLFSLEADGDLSSLWSEALEDCRSLARKQSHPSSSSNTLKMNLEAPGLYRSINGIAKSLGMRNIETSKYCYCLTLETSIK